MYSLRTTYIEENIHAFKTTNILNIIPFYYMHQIKPVGDTTHNYTATDPIAINLNLFY